MQGFFLLTLNSMITVEQFENMINQLGDVEKSPHFEAVSYKVNKKIFATLNEKAHRACVKLNEIDQSAFCAYNAQVMYPVPNKWGKHGWTNISLELIEEEMLSDALQTAYGLILKGKTKK
jgi:predicted DNA-binding protein (MmcQ/YjbR family)